MCLQSFESFDSLYCTEEKLLPPNIRACSLKLGGHKAEVQLAGASAPEGSGLAVLNAGCYVI